MLLFTIAVSAFIPSAPESYYGFSFTNAALQSVIGVYLSTSVTALASFFGPLAIQHVMSGQAAVAVVISIAQLLSTIVAVRAKGGLEEGQGALAAGMGSADASAAIFFSISTTIMVCALVAHWYLRRIPIYHEVMGSFGAHTGNRLEEEAALLPAEARGVDETGPSSPVKVLRVSKGYLRSRFQVLKLCFKRRSRGRTLRTTLRSSSISL